MDLGKIPPWRPLKIAFLKKDFITERSSLISLLVSNEMFKDHSLVTEYPFVRFYAEIPLITTDETKLGTLCICNTEPNCLSHHQRDGLRTLARQIILQIELKLQKRQLKQLNTGLLKD